jgi:hypothetical protein
MLFLKKIKWHFPNFFFSKELDWSAEFPENREKFDFLDPIKISGKFTYTIFPFFNDFYGSKVNIFFPVFQKKKIGWQKTLKTFVIKNGYKIEK